MYNPQDIADRIKKQAKQKHISIKDLLSDCELGVNTISQLSKGQTIAYSSLVKIADKLECSIDYLIGRTRVVKVIDLPNDLAELIIRKYKENDIDTFITLDDIIQAPQMNMKNYFVRNIDFDKILEIYKRAKKHNDDIMSSDDYLAMFKEYTFKILGYDASGYVITPANYSKLKLIYNVYKDSFIA
ncbi:MAG: helix-turn-helix domain-containing protein [Clostridiales bacterium]|nr:helix-turn-helix domain-containing protein [Clostridiales bacterium]